MLAASTSSYSHLTLRHRSWFSVYRVSSLLLWVSLTSTAALRCKQPAVCAVLHSEYGERAHYREVRSTRCCLCIRLITSASVGYGSVLKRIYRVLIDCKARASSLVELYIPDVNIWLSNCGRANSSISASASTLMS